MKRIVLPVVLAGLAAIVVVGVVVMRPGGGEQDLAVGRQPVLAVGGEVASTVDADQQRTILALAETKPDAADLAAVTIDYPIDGSIFPPDMIAPTFLWHDPADKADRWVIDVALGDGEAHIYALVKGGPPVQGEIDPECLGETNEVYEPTAYQASANSWTPGADVWAAIKKASVTSPARITIIGYNEAGAGKALSAGTMTLTTSTDPVGAPIFYRDVPLMPLLSRDGTIQPLPNGALPLIAWRLKDVSRADSRVVLTNMPTCGNCHSFSTDGKTLGMDIDGPSGDKGAYAVVPVSENIVVEANDIITWNSFEDKPADHKTIGFLSRVSPDGRYVISTVNEAVYVVNFLDYRFLQVFYPTRGILAYYSRSSGKMNALPGADDQAYVHCDPVWSPDGETIVFARAAAKDSREPGRKYPDQAGDDAELRTQYDLYRIPFNDGQGGEPEPIEGASANGMSNTFPKVSPDGEWIVFVKCANGQLMRPDSRLWIVPAAGGDAREMNCNTDLMNSWHSFSPNGRWMVFSSKSNTPYTQMFLTHIDEDGNDSPPILIANATAANRAVNIPEFVNIEYDDLQTISTPTVEYYRHFQSGNDLKADGRYEEAIVEYRKALEAEPTSTRINQRLADAMIKLGRYDEVVVLCERILAVKPNSEIDHFNLGWVLDELGRVDEAVVHYRRTIEIAPDYSPAHYSLARALFKKGRIDEAVEHYQKVLIYSPLHVEAHNNLGFILQERGNINRAMWHYNKALEVDPEFALAHYNLALALKELGRTNEAITHYRRTVEIAPRHVAAQYSLAMVLAEQGEFDEAAEHFRSVLHNNPNHAEANSYLGLILHQQGDVAQAMQHYNRALEAAPESASAHFGLAMAMDQAGRTAEAIAHYRRALNDATHGAKACNNLAWILATAADPQLRDGAEAVRLGEIASGRAGNSSPERLDTLAAAYAEAGRFDDAVETAETAISLARGEGMTALADDIATRLALYRQGRPFHSPPRGQP